VQPGQQALTQPWTSTPTAGPATDLPDAWQKWAILKKLEKPGIIDINGVIDPQKLSKSIPTAQRGTTEFNKLATAGGVLSPGGKDSGSARNYILARALAGGGLGIGAGYFDSLPDAATAGTGVAALALAKTAGGRAYLRNSVMNTEKGKALARALQRSGTIAGAHTANQLE
jgi:hypothetical protein